MKILMIFIEIKLKHDQCLFRFFMLVGLEYTVCIQNKISIIVMIMRLEKKLMASIFQISKNCNI